MFKTIIFGAAAIFAAATASASLAAQARPVMGDDYARYSSIEGPNAPLMQSFAPNRDDALLTSVYGPYDYMFDLRAAMDRDAVHTASTSAATADPRS